jgi:hypothetical protein
MTTPPAPAGGWRKSSYSGSSNNCVEVTPHGTAVAVRDSKDPHSPALTISHGAWDTFTRHIKNAAPPPRP